MCASTARLECNALVGKTRSTMVTSTDAAVAQSSSILQQNCQCSEQLGGSNSSNSSVLQAITTDVPKCLCVCATAFDFAV
eukprot:15599-Heterococcus_DN1.PRE.3